MFQTHNDYGYYAMWNSYFNVDTFLLVSGLLRAYNYTKELGQNRFNLFKSSLQRYLRLTPAYLFVILFYVAYFDRLDSGPTWNQYVGRNSAACSNYWWQNLLYINNYVSHNDKVGVFFLFIYPDNLKKKENDLCTVFLHFSVFYNRGICPLICNYSWSPRCSFTRYGNGKSSAK